MDLCRKGMCSLKNNIDIKNHSEEVKQLWDAFGKRENRRIPLTFACDEHVWLKISGKTFKEFYTDPQAHLMTWLEGKHWFLNNAICDINPNLPDEWLVGVQNWMDENEVFGCSIVHQENDYAWAMPLKYSKEKLLDHLGNIDMEAAILNSSTYKMYMALNELILDKTYADRPIKIAPPGGSTQGPFTKAAEIRGIENFCIDMCEDPEFVDAFLNIVTRKTIERQKIWYRLTRGEEMDITRNKGYHFCDDSIQLISANMYSDFVLTYHEMLYSAMTKGRRTLHLCGRSEQHYDVIREKLGVELIDGPGTFVDHGKYLNKFGDNFGFVAQTDNSILGFGSIAELEHMMKGLLSPSAKKPGCFQIMGFVHGRTNFDNLKACYELVKNYGVI